jgi:hypothetical protein
LLCKGAAIIRRYATTDASDQWIVYARGVYQVYKDLLLLESYAILTYCAFSKILKKHDKRTGKETREQVMQALVQNANFTDTSQLQSMIRRCEILYNEATEHLVDEAQQNLHEDERLFISMVARMNSEVIVPMLEEENLGSAASMLPMANQSHFRGKVESSFDQSCQTNSNWQQNMKAGE